MPRVSGKTKAERNKTLWNYANTSERAKWLVSSQRGYDFVLNDQLTAQERKDIREAGMPDFIINRVTPIIEIMKYFVTANNPKWKAVGFDESDTDIAAVHSDLADYCWYISNGKATYSQVAFDALAKGLGYMFIDIDPDMDNGQGEVIFKSLQPYDVFVDPLARDFLFRDAAYISIRKRFSREQLLAALPRYAAKIKKVTSQPSIYSASQRNVSESDSIQPDDIQMGVDRSGEQKPMIDYYETYERESLPFVNVFIRQQLTEGELSKLNKIISVQLQEFTKEAAVQLEERLQAIEKAGAEGEIIEERASLERENAKKMFEMAVEEKRQELTSIAHDRATRVEQDVVSRAEYDIMAANPVVAKNIVNAIQFYDRRVKVTVSVGDDTFLYEEYKDWKNYNIIPLPYMYTGTVYPISAVIPMIGKQEEINKAHQIMLHNANLASNVRWLYQEGSIPEEEWEDTATIPGAKLKYRPGFEPPIPVMPQQINNAFYTITQEGKADIEYIAGIQSSMMGITKKKQPEPYRGILAQDEYGTRRIKSWMNSVVEPMLEHVGRVFQEIAQSHYTIDKVFRIVQPEAGKEEQRKVRINVPIYNDLGEEIGKYKDYAKARFDVRIVAGGSLPVNRWALLDEYFRWFQAELIDDIAMLGETDIRNKEEIIDRKSKLAQAMQRLEQMDEAVKDRDGTIETLSRQLVQAGIKAKVDTADKEIQRDVAETDQQQKLMRGLLKGEFDTLRKNIGTELKSFKKELDLIKRERKLSEKSS